MNTYPLVLSYLSKQVKSLFFFKKDFIPSTTPATTSVTGYPKLQFLSRPATKDLGDEGTFVFLSSASEGDPANDGWAVKRIRQ